MANSCLLYRSKYREYSILPVSYLPHLAVSAKVEETWWLGKEISQSVCVEALEQLMKAVGASSTNTCTIHDQKSPSSIHELTSPRPLPWDITFLIGLLKFIGRNQLTCLLGSTYWGTTSPQTARSYQFWPYCSTRPRLAQFSRLIEQVTEQERDRGFFFFMLPSAAVAYMN